MVYWEQKIVKMYYKLTEQKTVLIQNTYGDELKIV